MPESYDFVIIGGGVVGCMLARWLSRYEGSVLLIEKEADICMGGHRSQHSHCTRGL